MWRAFFNIAIGTLFGFSCPILGASSTTQFETSGRKIVMISGVSIRDGGRAK